MMLQTRVGILQKQNSIERLAERPMGEWHRRSCETGLASNAHRKTLLHVQFLAYILHDADGASTSPALHRCWVSPFLFDTVQSPMIPTSSITVLVHDYANGDRSALDRLLPLVYTQLRRIAQKHLRDERAGHTLAPTALVHEMYLRLAGQTPPDLRDRVHFLSVAAHVMRQILVDHARTKYAEKRGGRQEKLSLDDAQSACMEKPAIMVQIDDALNQLARQDERKARLIEMRFFGGLTAEESAVLLDLPAHVVRRELRVAQAWLQRELNRGSDEGSALARSAS
jgi:RNA polymerase sigma factor (TIGR02999 family)